MKRISLLSFAQCNIFLDTNDTQTVKFNDVLNADYT